MMSCWSMESRDHPWAFKSTGFARHGPCRCGTSNPSTRPPDLHARHDTEPYRKARMDDRMPRWPVTGWSAVKTAAVAKGDQGAACYVRSARRIRHAAGLPPPPRPACASGWHP